MKWPQVLSARWRWWTVLALSSIALNVGLVVRELRRPPALVPFMQCGGIYLAIRPGDPPLADRRQKIVIRAVGCKDLRARPSF